MIFREMTPKTSTKRDGLKRSVNRALNARVGLTLVMAALALSMIGPFGTYTEMSFVQRLAYWSILIMGIGGVMIFVTRPFLWLRAKFGLPAALCLALGTAVAAIPGTAMVYLMNGWMRSPALAWSFGDIVETWINVAFVGFLISLVETARHGIPSLPRWMPQPTEARPSQETRQEMAKPERAFRFETLPSKIMSMTMQDHYVHITSATGTELALMRFSDAIALLEPGIGTQIHRSHWVAWRHVTDFERDGHKGSVILSDGRRLPVSRSYVATVQSYLAEHA